MERLKNKKILITGGTGFIGSHIAAWLAEQAKVSVIDLVIHPLSYFAQENLVKKVQFEKLDIRNREKTISYLKKNKFDYIFHLAAQSIVEDSYTDPLEAFDTNIIGTVNILEAVRKLQDGTGVIIASSDKAYGKTAVSYEEDMPLKGDHPYDVSKSCADLIAQTYSKTYGLPIVITRFGNVYGEGDFHMNRIIPGICESLIKQKTLLLRSDGTYVRDYIYIKDVVQGYLLIAQNLSKVAGQAFNFGSKDTLSVLETIALVEKVSGKKLSYTIGNTAKNEIPYQSLSYKKISQTLGWESQHTMKEVFDTILQWYKKVFL